MHCVGSYSFIHSLGTFVWGWAARSTFSHITRNNFLQTHSWKWFDNEKEINCMLSLSTRLPSLSLCLPLIRSHALGGSSCCCHLGLHSSAKHPFPPFAVLLSHSPPLTLLLSLSLSVIWCDMLHCVCVCVSFMHISNRAAYCSPPSRTDIPLHWGPHRALPLYSNCCPASSLAALLLPLYLSPCTVSAQAISGCSWAQAAGATEAYLHHARLSVEWKEAYSVYWLRLVSNYTAGAGAAAVASVAGRNADYRLQ